MKVVLGAGLGLALSISTGAAVAAEPASIPDAGDVQAELRDIQRLSGELGELQKQLLEQSALLEREQAARNRRRWLSAAGLAGIGALALALTLRARRKASKPP